MRFGFDSIVGIHEKALGVRTHRNELIANNLANADTPNYKARDIDFHAVLNSESVPLSSTALKTTDANHLGGGGGVVSMPDLLYRIPSQPSLDGNTVDIQKEQAAFGENAVRYEASLNFLDRRLKGIIAAFRGE